MVPNCNSSKYLAALGKPQIVLGSSFTASEPIAWSYYELTQVFKYRPKAISIDLMRVTPRPIRIIWLNQNSGVFTEKRQKNIGPLNYELYDSSQSEESDDYHRSPIASSASKARNMSWKDHISKKVRFFSYPHTLISPLHLEAHDLAVPEPPNSLYWSLRQRRRVTQLQKVARASSSLQNGSSWYLITTCWFFHLNAGAKIKNIV